MFTYLILNTAVLAVTVVILWHLRALHFSRIILWLTIILVILTVAFDSLIIIADIVHYDSSKLIGITIGAAPIEDLMYTILAIIIVPAIWKKLGDSHVQ